MKRTVAWWRKRLMRWVPRILSSDWHVRLEVRAVAMEEADQASPLASTNTQSDYRCATVVVNAFHGGHAEYDNDETIRHELGHVLVSPLSEFADRLLKQLPEQTRALMAVEKEAVEEQVVTAFSRMRAWEQIKP